MHNPVRTSASWIAGRVLVFLVILVALVVWDAYRDESLMLAALTKGLLPDRELVERLEGGQQRLEVSATDAERDVRNRLEHLRKGSEQAIDARITELDARIRVLEGGRLPAWRKAVAVVTGEGLEDDLQHELELQLARAERDALKQLKDSLAATRAAVASAESRRRQAFRQWKSDCAGHEAARASRDRFVADNPILSRVPVIGARGELDGIDRVVERWAQACNRADAAYQKAQADVAEARRLPDSYLQGIASAKGAVLGPLDELIAAKKAAVESAEQEVQRVLTSIRRTFLQAFGILILVTLAPVGIKAIWYWLLAPIVEKRPPIRIRMGGAQVPATQGEPSRCKISAVSQDIVLEDGDELLVHPDYLQSSTSQSHKNTKWLLDVRYPFTSIAAGMVMLTRVRSTTREPVVVSSRNDALSEVGVITLHAGDALVLQPRSLVGVVQRTGSPIRIRRRWVFSLSAWITLQFRYLVFEGPGKLLVQGCRGVRVEPAGTGRSIDQNATMGFSANLDYRPRRSETFSAYVMGVNGLFNDSFTGAPGYCVYEEMPYLGKRSGITGRGLEGITDGLLKVVGI
jgi:uncharacterized protein (AIM24 family)